MTRARTTGTGAISGAAIEAQTQQAWRIMHSVFQRLAKEEQLAEFAPATRIVIDTTCTGVRLPAYLNPGMQPYIVYDFIGHSKLTPAEQGIAVSYHTPDETGVMTVPFEAILDFHDRHGDRETNFRFEEGKLVSSSIPLTAQERLQGMMEKAKNLLGRG